MRSLAIIPARAGSKRVPGKNLQWVGGRRLWERAWDAAQACTALVVSTDVPEIAMRLPRTDAHTRKPEHASDAAQLEDVIADVLSTRPDFDAIVLLQPTSPFRTAAHVAGALAMLVPGVDSVVSVVRDPGYRFMGRTATNGEYRAYRPDLSERGRSQDALDHRCPVRENGAIYVTRRAAFERSGLRMSGVMRAYEMSVRDSIEIDEPWELVAADAVARSEGL